MMKNIGRLQWYLNLKLRMGFSTFWRVYALLKYPTVPNVRNEKRPILNKPKNAAATNTSAVFLEDPQFKGLRSCVITISRCVISEPPIARRRIVVVLGWFIVSGGLIGDRLVALILYGFIYHMGLTLYLLSAGCIFPR